MFLDKSLTYSTASTAQTGETSKPSVNPFVDQLSLPKVLARGRGRGARKVVSMPPAVLVTTSQESFRTSEDSFDAKHLMIAKKMEVNVGMHEKGAAFVRSLPSVRCVVFLHAQWRTCKKHARRRWLPAQTICRHACKKPACVLKDAFPQINTTMSASLRRLTMFLWWASSVPPPISKSLASLQSRST